MTTPSSQSELLTHLLDEMLLAHRSGQTDTLELYCRRQPGFAEQLRELFPAILLMEQHKSIEPIKIESDSTHDPLPSFSDYQIVREIGRGGMGVVYEAQQRSLGRRVALKVMSQHLARNASAVERFRREARSAAQLHHTNIVPVFEVGIEQGTSFYAMQFIHGQALDAVIAEMKNIKGESTRKVSPGPSDPRMTLLIAKTLSLPGNHLPATDEFDPEAAAPIAAGADRANGAATAHTRVRLTPVAPLPTAHLTTSGDNPGDAPQSPRPVDQSSSTSWGDGLHYYRNVARIGTQIADALYYAHGKNVIHRDVKPANILLDTSGVAWITDFGLAAIDDQDLDSPQVAQLTETGDVIGTLRYMAPERLQGKRDSQGDVYGLGVTLYEILTLQPVFQPQNRAELLEQVLHHQPRNPRALDPRIPRDLETIVLKAIQKEPKRRYASAREMAEDLRRFISNEPIRARRVGPVGRFRLWYRRNRWLAIGVCLSVASLAILSLGSVIASFTFRAQRDQANFLRGEMERTEKGRKHKSWEAYLEAAHGLRLSRAPGQRFDAIRAVNAALGLPLPPGRSLRELRTEAMAALCLPDFQVAHRWTIPTDSFIAGLNHDLTQYALVDPVGNVSLRRVASQQEICRLPSIGILPAYFSIRFSSDDSIVSQFNGEQLRLWRIAKDPELMASHDGIAAVDFDPQGKRLALLTRTNSIQIWDISQRQITRTYNLPFPMIAGRIAWNPRRDIIVVGSHLLDLTTGECQRIKLPADEIDNVTWDPSGRVLSFCDARGNIHLWDIDRQERFSQLLQPKLHGGTMSEFSHSADRLLATNWGQMWDLYDVASGRQLMSLRAGQTWIGFSSDDQLVGLDCWHGECRLFRFASGGEVRYIRADAAPGSIESERQIGMRKLSSDGRYLLFETSGLLQIVDLETGKSALDDLLPGRPLIMDAEGSLLTYGDLGLLKWTSSDLNDGTRRIGPPQLLANPGYSTEWAYDPFRKLVVIPREFESTLVGQITPEGFRERFQLGPQRDVRFSAISPDGRWIATGSHGSGEDSGCKIWSADSGAICAELPITSAREIHFSADGNWLLTLGLRPQLWETKTWTERTGLSAVAESAHGCFSDDSQSIVLEDERGMVRLVRTADGGEWTRFAIPDSTRIWPVRLARDGRLQLIGAENDSIYEIDLGRIRAQLKTMGLDWDQPPFDGIAENSPAPRSFTCDLGEIGREWQLSRWNALGNYHSGRGEYDQAISDFRRVLASDPKNASANNSLAWLMVSEPAHLRNPPEAVRLARVAVQQHPENAAYWNTLGTAYYRDGQWEEAIGALQKSEQRQQDTPEYDWLFLAMSHAQLGHADEARGFFERAQKSIQERSSVLPNTYWIELDKFLDEARKLLAGKIDPAQK